MTEIVSAAEAIKELGVIGLLALIVVVEALVIRQLYKELMASLRKQRGGS